MARITLKLTKPVDRDAPPKPPTSRAWRAHGKALPKAKVPAAVAATPAPTPATPAPADARRAAPASKPSRRGKPQPAKPARGSQAGTAHGGERRSSSVRAKPRPSGTAPLLASARATPSPAAAQPQRHANPDEPRLSKRMSELGLCSRREADEWIENGWVKVDGDVITTLGVRVSPHARIDIDPAAARHQSEHVTILLNKPIGYVSGQAEDGHEPATVLIKPGNRWADDPSRIPFKPSHLRGLAPAGRLDIDSTGLIVFTQDGRIAKQLVGRDSAVEKEYLVRVEGTLSDAGMKLLHHGLELDGVLLKPARVSWQNEHQLRFVLREGRKRQIRRMCELVGLVVVGLKRVRSGGVALGPLPVGQWRYLRRGEKF
jgi:23S rRNA pseudouridine2604 synthase